MIMKAEFADITLEKIGDVIEAKHFQYYKM